MSFNIPLKPYYSKTKLEELDKAVQTGNVDIVNRWFKSNPISLDGESVSFSVDNVSKSCRTLKKPSFIELGFYHIVKSFKRIINL